MSGPAAAGAPQGSVYDEGVRRSARLAAKAALMSGANAIKDPDLADSLADAMVAADEVADLAIGGRRRKLRGGSETAEAVKNVVKGMFSKTGSVVSAVDKALATLINTAGTALKITGAVGGAAVLLNHPTVLGNLSQLTALVVSEATKASITSTWGQWGQAILAVGASLNTLGVTVAAQTLQGPVLPVAIALAIFMWRANKSGTKITDVLKGDVTFVSSKVAQVITSQIQAFNAAKETGQKEEVIRQLRELASRARVPTLGEGAKETSQAFQSTGASSVEPSKLAETIALVPSKKERNYKIALKPLHSVAAAPVTSPQVAQTEEERIDEEDALALLAAVALMQDAVIEKKDVEITALTGKYGEELLPQEEPEMSGRKGRVFTKSRAAVQQRLAAVGKSPAGSFLSVPSSSKQGEAGSVVAPPPTPSPPSSSSSSTTPGGRRNKTRKTKKSKRRMTRRNPRVQIVKFAY